MRRHLCLRRDSVVALVAMVSLPLPMRRRLAVADDDGDAQRDWRQRQRQLQQCDERQQSWRRHNG